MDPREAATIWPWWEGGAPGRLADDALLAGANMPGYLQNADWSTYGQSFRVMGALQPSGTLLDDTMLMTLDAARRLARARAEKLKENPGLAPTGAAGQQLVGDPGDGVSAVLVLAAPGEEPRALAERLARLAPGVDAIPAPAYVATLRARLRWIAGTLDLAGPAGLGAAALLLAVALAPWRRATRSAAAGPRGASATAAVPTGEATAARAAPRTE